MHLTLDHVLHASAVGAAPITGDLAGYLLLGVADRLVDGPRLASPRDIALGPSGCLDVRGERVDEPSSVDSLRQLLRAVLVATRNPRTAVERVATGSRAISVNSLVAELETALIPVNRSAAQRALARLYRETARAVAAGLCVSEAAAAPPEPPAEGVGAAKSLPSTAVEEPQTPLVVANSSIEFTAGQTPRVPESAEGSPPAATAARDDSVETVVPPRAAVGSETWESGHTVLVPRVVSREVDPSPEFEPIDAPVGEGPAEPAAASKTPIMGSWLQVEPVAPSRGAWTIAVEPTPAQAAYPDPETLEPTPTPLPAGKDEGDDSAFNDASELVAAALAAAESERGADEESVSHAADEGAFAGGEAAIGDAVDGHESTPKCDLVGAAEAGAPDDSWEPVEVEESEEAVDLIQVGTVEATEDAVEAGMAEGTCAKVAPEEPESAEGTQAEPEGTAGEGVGGERDSLTPSASSRPVVTQTYQPRKSDVGELVAGFSVIQERSDKELSRDLKRLAGLSQTPPSVSTLGVGPSAASDEPGGE